MMATVERVFIFLLTISLCSCRASTTFSIENETEKLITIHFTLYDDNVVYDSQIGLPLSNHDICISGIAENGLNLQPDSSFMVQLTQGEKACIFHVHGFHFTTLDHPILKEMTIVTDTATVLLKGSDVNRLFKWVKTGHFLFSFTEENLTGEKDK